VPALVIRPPAAGRRAPELTLRDVLEAPGQCAVVKGAALPATQRVARRAAQGGLVGDAHEGHLRCQQRALERGGVLENAPGCPQPCPRRGDQVPAESGRLQGILHRACALAAQVGRRRRRGAVAPTPAPA
jgi:hypothetical protein